MDPNLWGISICTIDGQRFSFGDSKVPFCFQSVSKAFNYAIAATDLDSEYVHQFVGHEPSGRLFNEICLDTSNKPHNPMVRVPPARRKKIEFAPTGSSKAKMSGTLL